MSIEFSKNSNQNEISAEDLEKLKTDTASACDVILSDKTGNEEKITALETIRKDFDNSVVKETVKSLLSPEKNVARQNFNRLLLNKSQRIRFSTLFDFIDNLPDL